MDLILSTELKRIREELFHKVMGDLSRLVNRASVTEEVLEPLVQVAMENVQAEEELRVFLKFLNEDGKVGTEEVLELHVKKEVAQLREFVLGHVKGRERRAAEGEITEEGVSYIEVEHARDDLPREDVDSHFRGFDSEIYNWASTFHSENISGKSSICISLGDLYNLRSPRGNTVLHIAASVGNLLNVSLILESTPCLMDEKNKDGDLPLHLAASAGHVDVVSYLMLMHRTSLRTSLLNVQNQRGNTIMHVALENHHIDVATLLLDYESRYEAKSGNLVNMYRKTPLCMAVEVGNVCLVKKMLSIKMSAVNKLVLHAAIKGRNADVLRLILKEVDSVFLKSKDDQEWMTPLTLAAYIGNLDAVRCLLDKCRALAYLKDHNGFIPLLVASERGHIKIVEEFLNKCPDSKELLDSADQNILHVAAAHGRAKMVIYMLKTPELQVLINERDKTGNSPLHIAVKNWQPRIVRILTRDKRVNLSILNNAGMTALDVALESKVDKEVMLRKQLTFMALKLANAPRSVETSAFKSRLVMEDSYLTTDDGITLPTQKTKDKFEDSLFSSRENVKTLALVSTLVATVTFAAGFAVPGGYNNSGGPHDGMTTLGSKWPFQIFLICNTIATYSSITVVLALIWAQMGDLHMIHAAMRFVLPMLSLALMMMSIGFLAGVALVVEDHLWLSYTILTIGSIFIIIISLLFIPLAAPISSRNFVTRFILLVNFTLLMSVTRYDIHRDQEQTDDSEMDLMGLRRISRRLIDIARQIHMKLAPRIHGILRLRGR